MSELVESQRNVEYEYVAHLATEVWVYPPVALPNVQIGARSRRWKPHRGRSLGHTIPVDCGGPVRQVHDGNVSPHVHRKIVDAELKPLFGAAAIHLIGHPILECH